MTAPIAISTTSFHRAFERFRELVSSYDKGQPFTNFHEGVAAVWEEYKPRLRARAREILAAEKWTEAEVGAGNILDRVIASIEIQDQNSNLTNNLVFWQNRYGHANRDHRALLEARASPGARKEFERLFFGLYRGDDDGATFDRTMPSATPANCTATKRARERQPYVSHLTGMTARKSLGLKQSLQS